MKAIRINDPRDGQWIMDQIGSASGFDPEVDRCIANHRDGVLVGGFAFQAYTGSSGSIMVHMAGRDRHWCSRDLLWMCFDYAFNQLKVTKLIAPVPERNLKTVIMDMRAGYTVEARIEGVFPDGSALIFLSMTRERCRWLDKPSVHYRRNYELTDG